jgi:hypothetical protein
VSDLIIAKEMGWRYEWVRGLPVDVYDILVDELHKQREKH